jgi:histidine ammonia-lyase
MGTIAARDCIRVIELTEQVCAATLFAFSQAVEIRVKRGELEESALTEEIRKLKSNVLDVAGFVSEDRRLDKPLEKIIELISNQHFYAEIPVL